MNNEQTIALILILSLGILIIKDTLFGKPNKERQELINRCILLLRMKTPGKDTYEAKASIYERFYKNKYDNMALTALASDILQHCGLKPAALYVKVEAPDERKAGQYQIRGNASTITIFARPNYTHSQIMGILIHECMHFYLRARNIKFNDPEDNEILTDVTTIYMGFGRYTAKTTEAGIGYIKPAEVRYIEKTIKQIQENN